MKDLYILNINYSLKKLLQDDSIDTIIEKHMGKECDGSGGGFGGRDMSFYYPTERKMKNAYLKAKKLKIHGVKLLVDTTVLKDTILMIK